MELLKSIYYKINILFVFVFICSGYAQENKIEIKGSIVDQTGVGIPYASIAITYKYVGTSTTDEGSFYFLVSKAELLDTLEISCIGYNTLKIKVEDFIALSEKTLVLEDNITMLSGVEILSAGEYVKRAIKNIKNTTISKPHQLKMLYRRASVENGKTRFFIEQYLNVLDKGPSTANLTKIQVVESRKSADYRYAKIKQNMHAVNYMPQINPLRFGIALNQYKWKKIGDTNYDGEDVVIIEGRLKNKDKVFERFYIGLETYSVYKIERSKLNSTYIYKKNLDGKLYLSYHNREWNSSVTVDENTVKIIKAAGEKLLKGNTVRVSYRHEAYVLGVETDNKKNKFKEFGGFGTDMGDLEVPYNLIFWQNFSLPPETKFFNKTIEELESIYGVPLETQFKFSNKVR